MASQEISYVNANDDGERVATSVAPISDSELVKAAITNRPTECLRNRSEVIRDALIDQRYLADTDIRWFMSYGADVTGANPGDDLPLILWDPATGTFTIDTVLLLQPIKTPDTDTTDVVVYTFGGTDTLTITSLFRNYAGGNRRRVVWVWTPMTGATAVLSGTPNHILTISVDSGGSTQTADVDGALAALGGALGAAGFSHVLSGGTDYIVAPPADYDFVKNFEREMHRIPASQFVAFFAVPANALADGDTLAVYYEYSIEPGGTGGRRQSCPTNLNISITWGQLCILSAGHEPEKLPLSVPICKRIGDDLVFLDGTVCYGKMTPAISQIFAGEHGYTVDRIINAASTVLVNIVSLWADTVAPTGHDSTINAALNGIVADLAGDGVGADGAGKIGAEKISGVPSSLATETVGGQLDELLTLTNARIKSIHPTASSVTWICLWRSNNIANDAAVTKDTTSLYWKNGAFSILVGGYWSSATNVTAGLVGTGVYTGVVVSIWTALGGILTFAATAPAPGAVLVPGVPTDWDVCDAVGITPATNYLAGIQKTFNCDIKYGQDYVALRASFSTTDWHLVYRDDGQTTTPGDITWSTLSIYEKVDTNANVSHLEIYGGYLSGVNTITAAPGGIGDVSFRLYGNGFWTLYRNLFAIRGGVAGGTALGMLVAADWDLYESWADLGGGIVESTLRGRLSTMSQSWYLRNKFENPIEINDNSELNAALVLGGDTEIGTGAYTDYLAGAQVAANKLAQVFMGPGTHRPSIWYDKYGMYITVNANYRNTSELWACIDVANCATAIWVKNTGEIYQLYKAATAGTWSVLNWDRYQLVSPLGTTSFIYTLPSLADGVATPTTIPDTLCGLFVVNMTFGGQRRCGVYRMDGAGIYLVSGNEDAGAAVWSDVLFGTLETCQLYVNAGFVVVSNLSAAGHMTNITIGAYLGA